jgi:hypothetical protein
MPFRLTIDRVNSYVLHRQHLMPDSRGSDVVSVARDIGPIRATPAITCYLSLWARCVSLQRSQLHDALYRQRALVRVPAIHSRIYIISTDHLPAYFQVSRSMLGEALQDLDTLFPTTGAGAQSTPFGADLAQRVLEVMNTLGPCTIDELGEWLPVLKTPLENGMDHPGVAHSRWGARLIPTLCAQGLLIRTDTVGGWRSERYRYAALASWLPHVDLHSLSFEEAIQQVVLHYVTAFGPVSVGDIIRWLGGISRQQVVATVMGLSQRLVHLQIDGFQGEYFCLRDQLDTLLTDRSVDHDVVLLPPHDSLMSAYSDPHRLTFNYERMNQLYDARIRDRAGEAMGTVWLDGIIVGTWGMQIKESRISVRLFEPQDPETLALVGEEARRLGRWADFAELEMDIKTFAEEEAEEEDLPLVKSAYAD